MRYIKICPPNPPAEDKHLGLNLPEHAEKYVSEVVLIGLNRTATPLKSLYLR
jgi:hypothetical protein